MSVKCAILGFGYMGEIRLREMQESELFEPVLVCETNPDKRAKVKGVEVTDDPEQIFRDDIDAVFVCTPNDKIPDFTCRALKAGKHVFAEKPPGRNYQDIKDIIAVEKECGDRKLMFGFNHRYHPGMQRAKKLIDNKTLGKVLWVRGLYGKSGGKNFGSSWRNKKEISGGGILLDQGIHMLDLFNFFCEPFNEVKAFTSDAYWQFELEDNAFVILKNPEGQNAMLHSSATFWKHRFQIDIGLEEGYLTVQGFLSKSGSYGRETLIIGRKQFEDETDAVGNPSEEIIYFDKDLSWQIEMEKFADCVLNDKPVKDSTSAHALAAMEIVHKAYINSGIQQG